jgi:Replication initiator protein A
MDSEEGKTDQTESELPKIIEAKDELNLAEFPLSAISDRLNPDQKTLTFEDRIWDESRGEMITRQLTISASDQHGLPTALDDEVILGLVQLSKLRNFSQRTVPFTRYQLIQLLGWRDETKSYERIEKSLNRWVGVTLYYQNAWRNKKDETWVDEKFHILDNVTLYDRDKARSRPATQQPQLPLSSFTWNDVIFRSFNAGNLKSIDFDFFKSLNSAIAKRLYRFLDKRFHHSPHREFNLNVVSWEHVGLARSYDTANLKRKLLTGIRELESRGFLHPLPDHERFLKVRSGEWRVVFEKARSSSAPRDQTPAPEHDSLIQALLKRGVTPSTAQQTVATYPAERIQTHLEVFDWLLAQQHPKLPRNPAGFLISSIKSEYAPPKAFLNREEQARREAQSAERKRQAETRARAKEEKEMAQRKARDVAIENFWLALSDEERQRLEAQAIAQGGQLERDLIERGGTLGKTARKMLLDAYALSMLQEGA